MFPGGMNPRQMKQMMGRMGIKSDDIEATKVVIHCLDKNIVIEAPEVVKMTVSGQQMYSISGGKTREEIAGDDAAEASVEITEEDIKMVAEQANVSEAEAKKALTESGGDIAEAIMKLKG
jgi:nascent polypeptide-associated complex subunit alpha